MTNSPPALVRTADADLEMNSLAGVVEFFLNFDERVAAGSHPDVGACYEWGPPAAHSNVFIRALVRDSFDRRIARAWLDLSRTVRKGVCGVKAVQGSKFKVKN